MKTKGSLRRIAPEIRSQIYEAAIRDRETPRGELAKALEKRFGEKQSPNLDTIAREISKARTHPPSELDQPWSIGACLKYNIPAHILLEILNHPDIVELDIASVDTDESGIRHDEDTDEYDVPVSLRLARWLVLLYPVLHTVTQPLSKQEARALWFLAQEYSAREEAAEIRGRQYADTTDLDMQWFGTRPILRNIEEQIKLGGEKEQ